VGAPVVIERARDGSRVLTIAHERAIPSLLRRIMRIPHGTGAPGPASAAKIHTRLGAAMSVWRSLFSFSGQQCWSDICWACANESVNRLQRDLDARRRGSRKRGDLVAAEATVSIVARPSVGCASASPQLRLRQLVQQVAAGQAPLLRALPTSPSPSPGTKSGYRCRSDALNYSLVLLLSCITTRHAENPSPNRTTALGATITARADRHAASSTSRQ
jgi:hypothetical protein